jgi:PTH2 family peptidyl-tRNA hydrolase
MSSPLVMYIIVCNDIQMGKGKIASQVGHIVQEITEDIMIKKYESKKKLGICIDYDTWKKDGCKKIVLKASHAELMKMLTLDSVHYIVDAGKTQVEPGSLTVVGFPPMRTLGDYMKQFKLL